MDVFVSCMKRNSFHLERDPTRHLIDQSSGYFAIILITIVFVTARVTIKATQLKLDLYKLQNDSCYRLKMYSCINFRSQGQPKCIIIAILAANVLDKF